MLPVDDDSEKAGVFGNLFERDSTDLGIDLPHNVGQHSRLDRLGRSTVEVLRTLERVTACGGHIVVHVNGIKTAELKDDPGRREGKFAFQVHGGQDCEVWFKDVEIQAE